VSCAVHHRYHRCLLSLNPTHTYNHQSKHGLHNLGSALGVALALAPPFTRLSMLSTTSPGVVTCQSASVRLLECPTAVLKMPSFFNANCTGCAVLSASVIANGGSIVSGASGAVGSDGNNRARNMSSSVLSSPAQNTNSASGFSYRIRLTISPLLTAEGRTSRFFLPTRMSMGRLLATLFSNRSWHWRHWNKLRCLLVMGMMEYKKV
jgi:hypothetical protein